LTATEKYSNGQTDRQTEKMSLMANIF